MSESNEAHKKQARKIALNWQLDHELYGISVDHLANLEVSIASALAEKEEACCRLICLYCQRPKDYKPAQINGLYWKHKLIGGEIARAICEASFLRNQLRREEGK